MQGRKGGRALHLLHKFGTHPEGGPDDTIYLHELLGQQLILRANALPQKCQEKHPLFKASSMSATRLSDVDVITKPSSPATEQKQRAQGKCQQHERLWQFFCHPIPLVHLLGSNNKKNLRLLKLQPDPVAASWILHTISSNTGAGRTPGRPCSRAWDNYCLISFF